MSGNNDAEFCIGDRVYVGAEKFHGVILNDAGWGVFLIKFESSGKCEHWGKHQLQHRPAPAPASPHGAVRPAGEFRVGDRVFVGAGADAEPGKITGRSEVTKCFHVRLERSGFVRYGVSFGDLAPRFIAGDEVVMLSGQRGRIVGGCPQHELAQDEVLVESSPGGISTYIARTSTLRRWDRAVAESSAKDADEEVLRAAYAELGPRARRLALELLQRLVKGAREHGDFETPRDWSREALEEDLDGIIYRTVRSVRLGER